MRINNNIPALQAYTNLLTSNRRIDRSTIRLSSGIRINSVRDDAAGMAIANKLSFQVGGIDMAARNTMDGISIVQVAEGALQETHNMLQRIRELAVQASNDTNQPEDRWKMNEEARQLIEEISDVAKNTEFNHMRLLFGDAARLAKVPEGDRPYVEITYMTDNVPNEPLSYQVDSFGLPATVYTTREPLTTAPGVPITQADITAAAGQSITIGRDSLSISVDDTVDSLRQKFNDLLFTNDLEYKTVTGGWMMYTKDSGSDQEIKVSGGADALKLFSLDTMANNKGTDAVLSAAAVGGETYEYTARGNHIQLEASNGKKITMELLIAKEPDADGDFNTKDNVKIDSPKNGMTGTEGESTVFTQTANSIDILNFGMFQIHIGANKNQVLKMQIPSMTMEAMHIEYLHMKSFDGAQRAIGQCDEAIQYVSEARGRLGAYQNRLEHTHASLGVTGENTSGALSRIYDTDMAKEMTDYTTANVIMQAGMAILAQANQRPQQILQLLN